jgi:hypothetical protein
VLARRPAVALRASLVFGWTQRLTAALQSACLDTRAYDPGPMDGKAGANAPGEAPVLAPVLEGNFGAVFTLFDDDAVQGEKFDEALRDRLKQAIASHRAVQKLDASAGAQRPLSRRGVHAPKAPDDLAQALSAANEFIWAPGLPAPLRFTVDVEQAKSMFKYVGYSPPKAVQVRYDGHVFLALTDEMTAGGLSAGVSVREVIRDALERANIRNHVQPRTVAWTFLVIYEAPSNSEPAIEVIADSDDRAVALHLPGPFDHERFCDEAFLLLSPVMYDFYGVENLHTTAQHLEFATDDEPPPFFRTGLVWSSR